MEKGADEEHGDRCGILLVAHLYDGNVQVAHSPSMHGHIPRPPEDVDVVRVPPIAIEISIGEMQQFTDQIQKRVERQVEEAQPDQMIRYGQFQQTLGGLRHVHVAERYEGILHTRDHPLLEERHDHLAADHHLQDPFNQKSFPNPLCSREIQFVAEGRRQDEVVKITESQVVRILHQDRASYVYFVLRVVDLLAVLLRGGRL